MSNALQTLTTKLAATLDMGAHNGAELVATLKATAFKGGTQVTDAQMTALMVVANQYGLNPWTKEIYAFPDKGGIVPVVGVDGWARIINSHPQFDGIEFEQDADSCTAIIYRKDRSRPIKVTEYMAECRRANTGPWGSHPKRMLRHKAMIQCARLAFGYGGIHDPEEAEQIAGPVVDMGTGEILQPAARPALEAYPADRFEANLPKWRELVQTNQKTIEQIMAMVSTRASLSAEQQRAISQLNVVDVPEQPQPNHPTINQDDQMAEHSDFLAGLEGDEGAQQ
jgi:phage recombination protein Bet